MAPTSIFNLIPSYLGVAFVSGFAHVKPIKYYPKFWDAAEVAVVTQNKLSVDYAQVLASFPSIYNGVAGVLTIMFTPK